MSSTFRKTLKNTVAVSVGCSCRRPKLAAISPRKRKTPAESSGRKTDVVGSSSSSWVGEDDSASTLSFSESLESFTAESKDSGCIQRLQGKIGESVAVVKNSEDPYVDFRYSMLQMILEKEIYGREELRELLNCFLSLNSPCHHEIIVRAFTEIWNGVFSV